MLQIQLRTLAPLLAKQTSKPGGDEEEETREEREKELIKT